MAILPIRVFPDPILRRKARPIKRVDDSVRRLASDMIETMQNARGVGLAGPQVGELKRIVTIQVPEQDAFAMINPEITNREGSRQVVEGCLSVPGYSGLITRSVHINVRALDDNGGRFKLTAEELLAQAIEHEVVIYILGVAVMVGVLGTEGLSETETPVAQAAKQFSGRFGLGPVTTRSGCRFDHSAQAAFSTASISDSLYRTNRGAIFNGRVNPRLS